MTTDELLGLEPVRDNQPPRTARLLKRLQRIEELPRTDQQAVLKVLDALVESRSQAEPQAST